eukprot:1668763-Pleurochrysis_carterae.AAC.1
MRREASAHGREVASTSHLWAAVLTRLDVAREVHVSPARVACHDARRGTNQRIGPEATALAGTTPPNGCDHAGTERNRSHDLHLHSPPTGPEEGEGGKQKGVSLTGHGPRDDLTSTCERELNVNHAACRRGKQILSFRSTLGTLAEQSRARPMLVNRASSCEHLCPQHRFVWPPLCFAQSSGNHECACVRDVTEIDDLDLEVGLQRKGRPSFCAAFG